MAISSGNVADGDVEVFTIYVALDQAGAATYVGKTRFFKQRSSEFANRWKARLEAVVEIEGDEKARVVEQYMLNEVAAGRSWKLEDLRRT
jgi:hypothetical protein